MGADRISNLPDNLTDHILSYLPLCDVVGTSVLSRNWRSKWMSVPRLIFDKDLFSSLKKGHDIESIIYRALLHHKGPLLEFNLEYSDKVNQQAINTWIRILSTKQIHVLRLDLDHPEVQSDPFIVLPRHFFSFDNLTHLHISGVSIKIPPAFKGITKLVLLDVHHAQIEFGDLDGFLSKCPSVEFLHLLHCDTLGHHFVNARTPEYHQQLKSLTVINFSDAQCEKTDFVCCAVCLIRNSPNLQRLQIFGARTRKRTAVQSPTDSALQYLKSQQELGVVLPCLKNFEICFTLGTESEIEFVRLIILWGIVLKKLVIGSGSRNPQTGREMKKHFKMLGKLIICIKEASSSAQLVCNFRS